MEGVGKVSNDRARDRYGAWARRMVCRCEEVKCAARWCRLPCAHTETCAEGFGWEQFVHTLHFPLMDESPSVESGMTRH
jgi:hypothetical protein